MNSVGTVAVGLRKIDEMLLETEAEMDAMGAETVVDRLYSQRSTPEFTQLKEQWELGLFVHEHNKTHTPTLVWAGRISEELTMRTFLYTPQINHTCGMSRSRRCSRNPPGRTRRLMRIFALPYLARPGRLPRDPR